MPNRSPGREIWMAGVRVGDRYVRYSTRVTDLEVATEIELAVKAIAQVHRWRPILDAVLRGDLHPALVYDAKLKGKLDDLEHQSHQQVSNPRLEDYIEPWVRMLQSHGLSQARIDHYVLHVRDFCEGGKRLDDWTRPAVQDWLNALRLDRQFAPATVRAYHMGLRRFYGYLVSLSLIPEDDKRMDAAKARGGVGIVLPKVRRRVLQPGELYVATREQVAQLLAKTPESYKLAFALAYGAGAERGALIRMRGRDIDLTKKTPQVWVPGTKTETATDNPRARPVSVLDLFHGIVRSHAKLMLPGAWVSPVRDWSKLSKVHKEVASQVEGWPEGATLHCGRHFFAITLLQRGAPAKVVAAQLGHADETMVRRVYGNYLPDGLERDRWANGG